jgi:hypothetical protein
MSESDIVDAEPGEHIETFAKELRTIARARRGPVWGRHNDRIVIVKPESTIHDVVSQWHRQER